MIRSESEYKEAVAKLQAEKARLSDHRMRLRDKGLNEDDIKTVLDPIISFHLQLAEEAEGYEKLRRREFSELKNFEGLGRLLVAVRIAMGLSQRDLAAKLGVHESQVSRDERNEYFGITVDRASRIIDALGLTLRTSVDVDKLDSDKRVLEDA